MTADMKINAVAPWFGSNRMLAKHVGQQLHGCTWVGIPFAGGMAEVPHIDARTILVNDIHRHVINLASVMADDHLGPMLYRELRRMTFDLVTLAAAQSSCKAWESLATDSVELMNLKLYEAARNFFIACWMNRSALAGTDGEFRGGLPIRWSASGGDSAVRYHNAVLGIPAWRRVLRRCNFTTLDFREFLKNCKDEPEHGIYSDPPFPDAGDQYKYKFTRADHFDLAAALSQFKQTRVVCRFYGDHPLIEELYPRSIWTWIEISGGRKQSNASAPEVLLVRNGVAL